MLIQLALGSAIYLLYLRFFMICKTSMGMLKPIFGLPIFLPALAYYLFMPGSSIFFGLLIALFIYIIFFIGGDINGKLFLSFPLFVPAVLIFLFAPMYKVLFASIWIIISIIFFLIMIMIALKNFR